MTTTIMRDSIVGDAWIGATYQAAPPQRILDAKTSEFTGNFLTGPIRLAFPAVFELPKPTATIPNPKYSVIGLFTPYADWTIFYEEYYKVCASDFGDHYDAATQQYYGLHSPFHDQAEKAAKYGGFTPRLQYITFSTQYKPPVVDARGNVIVDQSKLYPGVWAIMAVNAYAYGKANKGPSKKGVGFGIQSIMLIADDTNLAAGAAANPQEQFKGINVAAPIARPDFSKMPAGAPPGAPPPGAVNMPGGPTIDTTYRQVPQQHYVPPVPPTASPGSDDDFMSQFGG